MDTDLTPTPLFSSPLSVMLACLFGLLVGLATFCVALPIAIIYWTLTASARTASAIRRSWITSAFGMSFSSRHLSKPFEL